MILKRLFTLNQFIRMVKSETRPDGGKLYDIFEYYEYLQQPLKDEMSVNHLKEPKPNDYNHLGEDYAFIFGQDFNIWQAAEKKLIFENVEIIISPQYKEVKIGDTRIMLMNEEISVPDFVNLHALAEATFGELKTKNIVI